MGFNKPALYRAGFILYNIWKIFEKGDAMPDKLKKFYFIQSIGILLWVDMYLTWIFDLALGMVMPLAVLAIAVNFTALVYAISRLDRTSMPRIEVIGGNLWVTADSLWAISDSNSDEIKILVIVARIFAVLLAVIVHWEFLASKDNTDRLIRFAKGFTKLRRM